QKEFLANVQDIDPEIEDEVGKIWKRLEKDTQAQPPVYRLTESAWKSLETAFPPATLKKLDAIKPKAGANGKADTSAWTSQKEFLAELAAISYDPNFTPHLEKAWSHLEKETKKPEVGEPSTKEWLPSPWQVGKAMYLAFVTPPVGA